MLYIVDVSLATPPGTHRNRVTRATVEDAYWSLGRSADGLEHIRARTGNGVIDIVLFVQAADVTAACRAARSLSERVVSTAPVLAHWRVTHCSAGTRI